MNTRMEMLKARILNNLKKAKGKPISRFTVGGGFYWVNDRKTRAAIAELRADGHPIGEISEFPGGYFYAQSKADLAPTIHRFRQRIKSCAKVLKGLELAHSKIKRQGKLKLD